MSVLLVDEVTGVCLFEGVMRGDVAGVDADDGGPVVADDGFGVLLVVGVCRNWHSSNASIWLELLRRFGGVFGSGKTPKSCSPSPV